METDEADRAAEKAETPEAQVAAEKKKEPATHLLDNPARVVPAQQGLVSFPPDGRWQPLRQSKAVAGILVLKDTRPGTPSPVAQPPTSRPSSPAVLVCPGGLWCCIGCFLQCARISQSAVCLPCRSACGPGEHFCFSS